MDDDRDTRTKSLLDLPLHGGAAPEDVPEPAEPPEDALDAMLGRPTAAGKAPVEAPEPTDSPKSLFDTMLENPAAGEVPAEAPELVDSPKSPFDTMLEEPAMANEAPEEGHEPPVAAESPLFAMLAKPEAGRPRPVPTAARAATEAAPADPPAASLASRLAAGLIDLAVHLGVVGILGLGCRLIGVSLAGQMWSVAVMVLVFSFLYTVPALLVWGRTPGAAAAGLTVRDPDGAAPAASRSLRRWVAQWVTWMLAGLPGLIRFADRWSGTRTVSS